MYDWMNECKSRAKNIVRVWYVILRIMYWYVLCMADVYRNPAQLADILQRYSSPVDTGIIVLRSLDVRGNTQFATTVDAVFFTRVHFDIFGLFFPRARPDLDSATKLLTAVYSSANLTLCVAGTESLPQSSSSSSSLSSPSSLSFSSHSRCVTDSLKIKAQSTEAYTEELATLRRFGLDDNLTKYA